MRTLRLVAAALLVSGAMAANPRGALANDVVRDCPQAEGRKFGNTGAYYGDLSVRNISCRTGMRVLRTGRFVNGKARLRGYRCSMIGTYSDGGIFRCTAGNRALRFSAGG